MNILSLVIIFLVAMSVICLIWLLKDDAPKSSSSSLILTIELEEALKNGMPPKEPLADGEQLILDFPTPITKYKEGRVDVMQMISEQYTIHRIVVTPNDMVKFYESRYGKMDKVHVIPLGNLDIEYFFNHHGWNDYNTIVFSNNAKAFLCVTYHLVLNGNNKYWIPSRMKKLRDILNKKASDKRHEERKALAESRDPDEIIDGSPVQWNSLPNNLFW